MQFPRRSQAGGKLFNGPRRRLEMEAPSGCAPMTSHWQIDKQAPPAGLRDKENKICPLSSPRSSVSGALGEPAGAIFKSRDPRLQASSRLSRCWRCWRRRRQVRAADNLPARALFAAGHKRTVGQLGRSGAAFAARVSPHRPPPPGPKRSISGARRTRDAPRSERVPAAAFWGAKICTPERVATGRSLDMGDCF